MEVRADTYLWAIRLFKTRTTAAEAIRGGKVKLASANLKPSHKVKTGEIYTVTTSEFKKTIEVTALLDKRKRFEIALQHYKELSTEKEKQELLPSAFLKLRIKREKGSGRPTKKDRRDMSDLNYF